MILELTIFVIVVIVMYIIMHTYKSRKKSVDFYRDTVIAYKVGLIHKKAKENKVDLIYPQPYDEFVDSIDEQVKSDLEKEEG